MKELLNTIASIEAKISGVKSQAKQAFDLANAGENIPPPAEKLR